MEELEQEVLEEVVEDTTDYWEKITGLKKNTKRRGIIVFLSIAVLAFTRLISRYHDFNLVLNSRVLVFALSFSFFGTIGAILYANSIEEKDANKSLYKTVRRIAEGLDILMVIPIFIAVITIINMSSLSLSNVDGESMEPNYTDNEDVVLMHIPFMTYKRLDPVVVKIDQELYYIKRIVGLPGEKIIIDNGLIYYQSNSSSGLEIIDQSDLNLDTYTFCTSRSGDYCEFIVPEGSYFVLGDNRTNSKDSRDQSVGFITEENMFGKVVFKYNNILRK